MNKRKRSSPGRRVAFASFCSSLARSRFSPAGRSLGQDTGGTGQLHSTIPFSRLLGTAVVSTEVVFYTLSPSWFWHVPSRKLCSHSSGKSNPVWSPVIHDDCHLMKSGSCRVTPAPGKARRGAEALQVEQLMIVRRQWKCVWWKVVWPWGLVSAGPFGVWISGCLNGSSCQTFPNHRRLPAMLDQTPWLERTGKWLSMGAYIAFLLLANSCWNISYCNSNSFKIFNILSWSRLNCIWSP